VREKASTSSSSPFSVIRRSSWDLSAKREDRTSSGGRRKLNHAEWIPAASADSPVVFVEKSGLYYASGVSSGEQGMKVYPLSQEEGEEEEGVIFHGVPDWLYEGEEEEAGAITEGDCQMKVVMQSSGRKEGSLRYAGEPCALRVNAALFTSRLADPPASLAFAAAFPREVGVDGREVAPSRGHSRKKPLKKEQDETQKAPRSSSRKAFFPPLRRGHSQIGHGFVGVPFRRLRGFRHLQLQPSGGGVLDGVRRGRIPRDAEHALPKSE